MQTLPTRPRHGFGSRRPKPDALTFACRRLARWIRRAIEHITGATLSDLRFNPFELLVESNA